MFPGLAVRKIATSNTVFNSLRSKRKREGGREGGMGVEGEKNSQVFALFCSTWVYFNLASVTREILYVPT